MLRYFLFLVLSSVVVFIATVFFRLGAHKDVIITTEELQPLGVLWTKHIGPYHEVNSSILKVEEWARSQNIPCTRTFGVYLDDPAVVDEVRLRSEVGCVLDGISSLILAESLPEWLQLKSLDEGKYVVAKFGGAPSIGPFKVYPKVNDYIEEHRLQKAGAPIEIYRIIGEREAETEYRFKVQ